MHLDKIPHQRVSFRSRQIELFITKIISEHKPSLSVRWAHQSTNKLVYVTTIIYSKERRAAARRINRSTRPSNVLYGDFFRRNRAARVLTSVI